MFDIDTYIAAKKYTDKAVEEHGGVDVDSELSETSINPVQNKVITQMLNNKVSASVIDESLLLS